MTENFGQVIPFKKDAGRALFAVGPGYKSRLSMLEGVPAGRQQVDDVYVVRQSHGDDRYATFRVTEEREGVIGVDVDVQGMSKDMALEYFKIAIRGKRLVPCHKGRDEASGISARMKIPFDYVDRIESGALSGQVVRDDRPPINHYNYVQRFGNSFGRNRRDVRVSTIRVGREEIIWSAISDNPNDERLAMEDFTRKIGAKLMPRKGVHNSRSS